MKKISKIIDDLLLITGMSFVSGGVFLIYIPAGFITSGMCLIGLGILAARRRLNVTR
ncbi:MAG: hypothetical protein H6Q72_4338 [Firmicutes bacterium]|nr:hypothetical protein [Bacillota bacterium]